METPTYTKHTAEELINTYAQVKGDAEFANYFIAQYNQAFNDFVMDSEGSDETPPIRTLNFCFEFYLPVFLDKLQKGHSATWAHEFAFSCEEEETIVYENYNLIKKMDPLWAQNELIIHCKSLGITDPIQINYYINDIDQGGDPENGIRRSAIFCDTFKSELAKGKSFVFSHTYANEKAYGIYTDTYCASFAWAFEQMLLKNKSEKYRDRFPYDFAEVIANTYNNFEKALKDEDFAFYINPVIAKAQANDYITTHEVENPERFKNLYVNIFTDLNVWDQNPLLQIDNDIDEEILKLTLEKLGM